MRTLLLLQFLLLLPATQAAAQPTRTESVEMRDGVSLATDLYLPDVTGGPAPAVLVRTPYGRAGMASTGNVLRDLGIAGVVQDLRGRFDSEGVDCVFRCDGGGDLQDGVDTVTWIEAQGWFDGHLVTYGGSALGIVQYALAPVAPASVKAMWPQVATSTFHDHALFPGGVFRKNMIEGWLEDQGSEFFLQDIAAHPLDDAFWDPIQTADRYAEVGVAAVHQGGWYDIFIQGTIDAFVGWQHQGGEGARGQQKLIMGPWVHDMSRRDVGELTYPANATDIPEGMSNLTGLFLLHHLGMQPDLAAWEAFPAVHYYVMGDVDDASAPGNTWRTADDWPVPAAAVRMHLQPDGTLAEACPPPGAAAGQYTYDPADPCPTLGGPELILPAGPYDQRSIEARADVLTFSTPVLGAPLEITGRVRAHLKVALDQPDADLMVRMTDVYPDGRSMLVLDGAQRVMLREGPDHLAAVPVGEVMEVVVDLWSTSIILAAGHRLRVSVTSSNAPRFRPGPNDGSTYGTPSSPRPVTVSLHQALEAASYLEIPVPGRDPATVVTCAAPDAGLPDAGPGADAGPLPPDGDGAGCGCASSGPGRASMFLPVLIVLLGLLGLSVRRRSYESRGRRLAKSTHLNYTRKEGMVDR